MTKKYTCKRCNKIFIDIELWEIHLFWRHDRRLYYLERKLKEIKKMGEDMKNHPENWF